MVILGILLRMFEAALAGALKRKQRLIDQGLGPEAFARRSNEREIAYHSYSVDTLKRVIAQRRARAARRQLIKKG